jgi:hypothetical protein
MAIGGKIYETKFQPILLFRFVPSVFVGGNFGRKRFDRNSRQKFRPKISPGLLSFSST